LTQNLGSRLLVLSWRLGSDEKAMPALRLTSDGVMMTVSDDDDDDDDVGDQ
jgi:hypothetical protein